MGYYIDLFLPETTKVFETSDRKTSGFYVPEKLIWESRNWFQ